MGRIVTGFNAEFWEVTCEYLGFMGLDLKDRKVRDVKIDIPIDDAVTITVEYLADCSDPRKTGFSSHSNVDRRTYQVVDVTDMGDDDGR